MDLLTLHQRLNEIERLTESAVFSLAQARVMFPEESDQVLLNSLGRHTRSGVLRKVATGIWLNTGSNFLSRGNLLHQVAVLLRPADFNYLSLESVLSEHSVISQQMLGYLTVMTTGAKRTYKTSLGTIEFTLTKRDPRQLLAETLPVTNSPLRRATVARAWADLKRVGRNIEMVDQDELELALGTTNTLYTASAVAGGLNV